MIVAAVAAWSWDRWQSGYSTAIAALSASACVLVVEIALSAASPWAGRALLGLREGGVGNPSSSAVPPSGMEPSDAGRGKEAAASRAAGPSRDEIERKLNDAEMRLQQAAARLESTHERIDELEQERTSMLGETVLARRALLQLIGTSLDGLAAVELEEVRQALAAAAQARGPLDAERPAGTPDTQPFAGSTPTRVSTVEKVIFAISSAAATVMVVLFVVVLWFA